jgi:hypothetical protein
MLVGFLLMDGLYLRTMMVTNLSMVVVTNLEEVVLTVLHEVIITTLHEVAVMDPKRPKSKIIHCNTNKIVDKAYLESIVPSMISY